MFSIGKCLARQPRILMVRNMLIMLKSTAPDTAIPSPVEETSADADAPKPEFEEPQPISERMAEFKRKLRENKAKLNEFSGLSEIEQELLKPWPNNVNPHTGEINGPRGPEPTRYGDWQIKGRVTDF